LLRLDDIDLHKVLGLFEGAILAEVFLSDDGRLADVGVVFVSATLRPMVTADITGRTFRELPGKGPGSQIWQAFEACVRERRPVLARLPYVGPDPEVQCVEDLLMPLADATGSLRYILSGVEMRREPPLEHVPKG
jgi:hypothetical protein